MMKEIKKKREILGNKQIERLLMLEKKLDIEAGDELPFKLS